MGIDSALAVLLSRAMGYLRLFRINLSQIDKGFCLILDDLEKNYRETTPVRYFSGAELVSLDCGDQGRRIVTNSHKENR